MTIFERLRHGLRSLFDRLDKRGTIEDSDRPVFGSKEWERDGWCHWIVHRYHEGESKGTIPLGFMSRERAMRSAARLGTVQYVEDRYGFIFIN
jgi:hypothetical protein